MIETIQKDDKIVQTIKKNNNVVQTKEWDLSNPDVLKAISDRKDGPAFEAEKFKASLSSTDSKSETQKLN